MAWNNQTRRFVIHKIVGKGRERLRQHPKEPSIRKRIRNADAKLLLLNLCNISVFQIASCAMKWIPAPGVGIRVQSTYSHCTSVYFSLLQIWPKTSTFYSYISFIHLRPKRILHLFWSTWLLAGCRDDNAVTNTMYESIGNYVIFFLKSCKAWFFGGDGMVIFFLSQ